MNKIISRVIALGFLAMFEQSFSATLEFGGLQVEDSVRVAGSSLKLNGAGIGIRYIFKVYLIGLYLSEPKHQEDEIISTDLPRRMTILMLRDVSGEEFNQALVESAGNQNPRNSSAPMFDAGVMQLAKTIASRPIGLKKGDLLTMDWVPGIGTVVGLNGKDLIAPVADKGFYAALLSIWIGPKPADPALKARLLGRLGSS